MTNPFDSRSWPTDPTMPSGPPAGYVQPTKPNPSKSEPPMTKAEVEARRQQFYDLLLQQIMLAIQGFFSFEDGSPADQFADWAAGVLNETAGVFLQLLGGLFVAATGQTPAPGSVDVPSLVDVLPLLLNTRDPVDAANLWGLLRPRQVAITQATSVQGQAQVLLVAPDFRDPGVVEEDQNWSWDGSQGLLTPGSLKVVAAGYLSEMVANEVPVTPRQKIHLSIFVKWQGLAYTGTNPICMGVTEYQNRQEGLSKDLVAFTSPAANGDWTELSADYEVPFTGVDEIRMRFKISELVTAGTIWFDQGDQVHTEVGTMDSIIQKLLGYIGTGWTHSDVAEALGQQVDTTLTHTVEISQLWSAVNTLTAGSNPVVVDNFERAPSSTLGSNWDENYGSGAGTWSADGHTAYWDAVFGSGNRESLCRYVGPNAASITDYQTNEVILGSAPTNGVFVMGYNDVIGRCDATEQNYIRFRVCANKSWWLSKFVAGSETVMSSGLLSSVPGAGAKLILICGDKATSTPRHFTAKIGTVVVATGTFGDVTSQFGAAFRFRGFGGRAESVPFSSPQAGPGKVDDFFGRDTT